LTYDRFYGSENLAPFATGQPVTASIAVRTVTRSADASPNSAIGVAHRKLIAATTAHTEATDHLKRCRLALEVVEEKLDAASPRDDLGDVARLLAAKYVAGLEVVRATQAQESAEQRAQDIRADVDSLMAEYTALARGRSDLRHRLDRMVDLAGSVEQSEVRR
jgi:hypothetical protein